MAPEKQVVIEEEKQSRGSLHEGSITMKLCRHLPTAHIRTTAGSVIFHLYATGFFYVLTSVAWPPSKVANKRSLKFLKFQLKTIWKHSNVHQQGFDYTNRSTFKQWNIIHL